MENLKSEVLKSIDRENGKFFHIEDPNSWFDKVYRNGKFSTISVRNQDQETLISYVAYYIDDEKGIVFISMVWTHPDHRGNGLSKLLLESIESEWNRPMELVVHPKNPAFYLYTKLGYATIESDKIGQLKMRKDKNRIAIMQPYIFPYIGYFNLIRSSNYFVFYDDVNYIKKGWINRNKVLINGEENIFTIPVKKASQNKLINEIFITDEQKELDKILKTIETTYKNAPFFDDVFPLIREIFEYPSKTISELAIRSIDACCKYMEIPFKWVKSSDKFNSSKGMPRADRLIQITKDAGYSHYINSGPTELYNKDYFKSKGIHLHWCSAKNPEYPQSSNQKEFVSHLSIIDAMMNCPKDQLRKMVDYYDVL